MTTMTSTVYRRVFPWVSVSCTSVAISIVFHRYHSAQLDMFPHVCFLFCTRVHIRARVCVCVRGYACEHFSGTNTTTDTYPRT